MPELLTDQEQLCSPRSRVRRQPLSKSVTNMHRGGVAAVRGSDFERLFATYRILVAATEVAAGKQVRVASQLKNTRVDDWVEDRADLRSHFQLKRVKKLGWSAVRPDFEAQRRVRYKGRRLELCLVVASQKVAAQLRCARRPVKDVAVVVFPGEARPERLLRQAGKVQLAAAASCVLEKPTPSDLEMIWKDVAFAWENARRLGRFVDVGEVIGRLNDLPTPIRRRWRPTRSWRDARAHLAQVNGVSVEVRSGMLSYSTSSGISGRLPCTSHRFRRFVEAVRRERPSSVESVLELL